MLGKYQLVRFLQKNSPERVTQVEHYFPKYFPKILIIPSNTRIEAYYLLLQSCSILSKKYKHNVIVQISLEIARVVSFSTYQKAK